MWDFRDGGRGYPFQTFFWYAEGLSGGENGRIRGRRGDGSWRGARSVILLVLCAPQECPGIQPAQLVSCVYGNLWRVLQAGEGGECDVLAAIVVGAHREEGWRRRTGWESTAPAGLQLLFSSFAGARVPPVPKSPLPGTLVFSCQYPSLLFPVP